MARTCADVVGAKCETEVAVMQSRLYRVQCHNAARAFTSHHIISSLLCTAPVILKLRPRMHAACQHGAKRRPCIERRTQAAGDNTLDLQQFLEPLVCY